VKLVSVARRIDGGWSAEKNKVCEVGADPWRKLANVLFVFADRLTRVVLGSAQFHLDERAREELARSWAADPHFSEPCLFVEARDGPAGSSPAYYVSGRWLAAHVLPTGDPGVGAHFDAAAIGRARREHAGRPALLTVVPAREERAPCPRCGGSLGWTPGPRPFAAPVARHANPGGACALHAHAVVPAPALPRPRSCSVEEMVAGVEGRVGPSQLWRLADRVPEPEDHLHGARPEK
jgi:hypothetical protein